MIDKAISASLTYLDLSYGSDVNRDKLREAAEMFTPKFAKKSEFTVDELLQKLESMYATDWKESLCLSSSKDHIDWLTIQREQEIEWRFWDRYKNYLIRQKKWTSKHSEVLHLDTRKVLAKLEDPSRPGAWFNKGMVVGDVQSGKTGHFTGLLNKAVDSGYKLIIVLAGIHNSLRSQTQFRLDEELVGFDSSEFKKIGVGLLIVNQPTMSIQQPTNSSEAGDLWSRQKPSQIGRDPILLVIKKNKTPLETLISWIEGQASTKSGLLENVPSIIIDDEADQASVNTKDPETDPPTINRLIRKMISLLSQKNYIGYTATPFANIFIDKNSDDLFPENFIFRVRPPSNYIGATKIFGMKGDEYADIDEKESLNLVSTVNDYENFFPTKHDKNFRPPGLPPSLEKALTEFLISISVRAIRSGENTKNTMLVHVTRFTTVQGKVAKLVEKWMEDTKQILLLDMGAKHHEFKEMSQRYYKDYNKVTDELNSCSDIGDRFDLPSFESVFIKMKDLVEKVKTLEINGSSKDVLDYKKDSGVYVVAIGGNKLSRGLTLDGLSISYYLRHAKAYDTLLQMGRWFGYRPGYLDLCRIYTTKELLDSYNFISLANEELNREFEKLEVLGGTPREWGWKVRTDPEGAMLITSPDKMRSGTKLDCSFSGKLIQTLGIHVQGNIVSANLQAFNSFLESLGIPAKNNTRPVFTWGNVKSDKVIQFLNQYKTHPRSPSAKGNILNEYIKKANSEGELSNWTVAVIGGEAANSIRIPGPASVKQVLRKKGIAFDDASPAMVYKALISKEDEALDFPAYTSKEYGTLLRAKRDPRNGLLLLYPISLKEIYPQFNSLKDKKIPDTPSIAFAISFPESNKFVSVEYTVDDEFLKRYGITEVDYEEVE